MPRSLKLSHHAFYGGSVTFEAMRVAIAVAAGGILSNATGALVLPRVCGPALLAFLSKPDYKGVIVDADQVCELAQQLQALLLKIPKSSGTRSGSSYDRTVYLIDGAYAAHKAGEPLEFK